jgi:HEAT repeat protein
MRFWPVLGAIVLGLALGAAGEDAEAPKPGGAAAREGGHEPAGKEPTELSAERLAELVQALDSKEAEHRARAARALGEAKAVVAVPKLIRMLDDPDDDAQWQATVALGSIGKPALPHLIDALLHPKERARWKAENALQKIGADAVPALVEALKDKRVRVRQSAAYLLGEIKDERCLEDLAAALADKDDDVRWKAATALTKFGAKATAPALKRLDDPSIEPRRCAAWIFQQTLDTGAVPSLVGAMGDPDEQVRWNAATALQKIGLAGTPILFRILGSADAKADLKNMAEWVLEGIKDEEVQKRLNELKKGAAGAASQDPPPKPRPAVLPKSVTLTVNSEPDKATVFVDDKYVGVSPLVLKELGPGHHFIKLTKREHMPWTKLVELLYPEEKLTAKLTPRPKGTLFIDSGPPQADVYLDGDYEGKTPFEKKNLDANRYSVRLEKEQFLTWETEVEIRPGQEARVKADLVTKLEGWYLGRLKDDPNNVACRTDLAHYYLVQGQLDKSVKAIAAALEAVANGVDTSAQTGRLLQEIQRTWNKAYLFGGNLELPAVQKALHAALHEVWRRNPEKAPLRAFLDQVRKAVDVDFTQPPK